MKAAAVVWAAGEAAMAAEGVAAGLAEVEAAAG